MAWTQTLALWKSNAAPPCSGPLIVNVTCCSLAAVFFPLCLAWNAREAISWYIHGETLSSGADEDAPFQITERSGTPKMIQGWCFLENRWFAKPSHIVTLVSSHHARHIKTCSRGMNMLIWPHPQPSALPALCRAPTVDGAVIGGIGTPPAGTRWAGSPHLQFWDAKAQRWALLCLLPLFAHMVFTLTNSTAVGPCNGAQWLRICLHFM